MTDATNTVNLDGGIDFRTPPLLAQTGTLVGCLNYEMTTDVGYRRIDGYERRDGWPTGAVSNYFEIDLTHVAGSTLADIDLGALITRPVGMLDMQEVGIVVATSSGGATVRFAPISNIITINAGDQLYIYTKASGYQTAVIANTVGATQEGRNVAGSVAQFYADVRNYAAVIRSHVQDSTSDIAGVFYSRDRSYEVRDAHYFEAPFLATPPPAGAMVRWNGYWYYFLGTGREAPVVDTMWYFAPTGKIASTSSLDVVDSNGSTVYASSINPSDWNTTSSSRGYMVWLHPPTRPDVTALYNRGPFTLAPSVSVEFDVGNTGVGGVEPLISGLDSSPTYNLYAAGTTNRKGEIHISQIDTRGGSWASGTATGRIEFYYTGAPNPFYTTGVAENDEIYIGTKGFGGTKIGEIFDAANAVVADLSGSKELYTRGTRYQWATYNFYSTPNMRRVYGTSGAARAFWANTEGYGNIRTQDDRFLDAPKYLNFHAQDRLGLGFQAGSYQMSATGVPYDFSGVRGALEVAIGDDITGCVSSYNDSTVVFGKRSIRRVTGSDDTTLAVEVISPTSGAFDYTCVSLGTTVVFTGPTGISTLEQTNAYGDFVGERASLTIHNWLIPRIVQRQGGVESAGVACAIPVRSKNQYRLFLKTGEVVSMHMGSEGAKLMFSNYSLATQAKRVPFAWSSEVSDQGSEVIQVVWDERLASESNPTGGTLPDLRRAYYLDTGWGFDGAYFPCNFDVVWMFAGGGVQNVTINQARLHGYGYGLATLDIKTAGLEIDYDQDYHTTVQDISMPMNPKYLYNELSPVTGIIDQGNWGLAIKMRINGSNTEGSSNTEPPHICQAIQLYIDEGAIDR